MLALDIGSSSTRAAVFNRRGRQLAKSTEAQPYSIRYTSDGGAEIDPAELLRAARRCIGRRKADAVAASAFWHGLLGLGRNGEPLTPVYTWADARSEPDAAQLRLEVAERVVQERTGCMLRAPFWPAKLHWLRRCQPRLFRRVHQWQSPATWIFRELFGCGRTSHSMASGSGVYNLDTRTWDTELCELCGIRTEQLGLIGDEPSESVVFPPIGDGAASNLGSGADRPGLVAMNIGTSAAARSILSRNARVRLPLGLFRYVVDGERDVVGGAISNAGNLHAWCLRELKLDDAAAGAALDRKAAATDTVTILPHLVSERAPTWPTNTGGTFTGITAATSAAEIHRAAMTAAYYRLASILDLLEAVTGPTEQVIVSGGVLKSPRLLAILADAIGRDLHVCPVPESSLRGAAVYALQRLGCEVAPLRSGRIIRQRPPLASKHRERRRGQAELERRMSSERGPDGGAAGHHGSGSERGGAAHCR